MPETDLTWMRDCFSASHAALDSLESQFDAVAAAADFVVSTFDSGHKVLTAGNGGSAAEAMHMAEEAVGRFRGERRSLPSVALVADGTALTCIGNDYGFDNLFSRQVEGLGVAGDLLVLFSTSGNGENLSRALDAARAKDMKVLAILGRDGGRLAGRADVEVIVAGSDSGRIQEAHQLLMHILLDAVDRHFGAAPRG